MCSLVLSLNTVIIHSYCECNSHHGFSLFMIFHINLVFMCLLCFVISCFIIAVMSSFWFKFNRSKVKCFDVQTNSSPLSILWCVQQLVSQLGSSWTSLTTQGRFGIAQEVYFKAPRFDGTSYSYWKDMME